MRFLKVVLGLLLGAAVGVGLMLLFTPLSGEEAQQWIRDRVQQTLEEGRKAGQARREELTAQFEALKQSKS
jgi:gas vesicle protein